MLGNKQFELSNHLGNVLTTVSDRKIPHTSDNITIDYYTSDITSAQDYYAFGQLMPGRNWSSNSYKFGFNGKLNDDEVFGATGSFQDYGMRMYDTRACRFISPDPIIIKDRKYPELSTYQFASNSPIANIDLDGLEAQGSITAKMQQWDIDMDGYKPNYKPLLMSPGAAQVTNGVANIACGLVGTIGLIGYIGGTCGVGAAVGGEFALFGTLTQMGIGMAQVIDGAAALSKDSKTKMPQGDNIYGLIAYGMKSQYAGLINIGADVASNLPGAGLKFILKSWEKFIAKPNILNSIDAVDATLSTLGFIKEVGNVINTPTGDSQFSNFNVSFNTNQSEKLGGIFFKHKY